MNQLGGLNRKHYVGGAQSKSERDIYAQRSKKEGEISGIRDL